MCFYIHPLRESLVSAMHRTSPTVDDQMQRVLGAGLSFAGMLVLGSLLVLFVFASTFGGANKSFGCVLASLPSFLPWLVPFLCLFALSEILSAILISFNQVVFQSVTRLVSSLALLIILIFFGAHIGVNALFLGQIISMISIVLLSGYALRRLRPKMVIRFVTLLKQEKFFPVFFSLIASYLFSHLYVLGERAAMSHLAGGLVSSYQYSVSLVNVIISLVAFPLANLMWPRFLSCQKTGDIKAAGIITAQVAALLLFALIIVCTFIWMHAEEIVFILFNRGAFDATSTLKTAYALRATIFTAIPAGILAILGRLLISMGSVRSQVVISLVTTVSGMGVIGISLLLTNTSLVQWHWLVANFMGLGVSTLAYLQLCRPSKMMIIRGCGWALLVVFSVGCAALLTPHVQFGSGKTGVLLTLAVDGIIFFAIAMLLGFLCGPLRSLRAFIRGEA
jgi:peptidoglycan biosynthesis protein MviN/MurJ (putative lipid II flippase)